MGIRILSTGSAVPSNIVDNRYFESFLDTSDEWIKTRTGIHSRHINSGDGAVKMSAGAAEKAIRGAGIDKNEIGLIVCGTITSDKIIPCLAAETRSTLGIEAAAFDINSACTGFLVSLIAAAGMLRDLKLRYALVIGSEILSRIVDWKDRASCVLFGDGAGAVVIEYGVGFENLMATGFFGENDVGGLLDCGNFWPDNRFEKNERKNLLQMNGKGVFRFAVNAVTNEILRICGQAGISPVEIDHFVPHQANIRIISAVAQKLDIPLEKFVLNIERYGNTSAASVPIALDELNSSGALERGQSVLTIAFGGGLSVASALFRW